MIYITGDTHGNFSRFSNTNWSYPRPLTANDYIIIAGDCGLLFWPEQTKDEKWWTKWLTSKPWTLLYVCGNHENFTKLNALPLEQRFGGTVGKIADNIFHLRRGEIYEIEEKRILTFGGAMSIDKAYRKAGVSWWPEEIPNYAEMDHCIATMERYNYCVDYIVAHTCPRSLLPLLSSKISITVDDPTGRMLDHITSSCQFDHFFCGHFHMDVDYGKFHFLYNRVMNTADLEEKGVDDAAIEMDKLAGFSGTDS